MQLTNVAVGRQAPGNLTWVAQLAYRMMSHGHS